MKELIINLLKETNMNEKIVVETIKKIEEVAYKKGFDDGVKVGHKNGLNDAIGAINFIKSN